LKRLGQYLLWSNICAMVLLLAALSFLSFLWFGDDNISSWRHIMANRWISQAITISTLLIRFAVATQASTAVTMLAALSFEAPRGVLLTKAPALSLARYVNTGPLTSIMPFLSSGRPPKCSRPPTIFSVICILALCTLISQATSTLLLWDISSSFVQGLPRTSSAGTGMSMMAYKEIIYAKAEHDVLYWQTTPQIFPEFAEWKREPDVYINSVVDTGPTIRALLPINSQLDRFNLNIYKGDATVFDARVACMRPNITGNVIDVDGPESQNIHGNVWPAALTEELEQILRYDKSIDTYNFDCNVEYYDILPEPSFKICRLYAGGLINSLDHTFNSSLDYRFQKFETPESGDYDYAWTWMASNGSGGQEWPLNYTRQEQKIIHFQQYPITAARRNHIPEPTLSWNSKTLDFNTTAVRQQLAATAQKSNTNSALEIDIGGLKNTISTYSHQLFKSQYFKRETYDIFNAILGIIPPLYTPCTKCSFTYFPGTVYMLSQVLNAIFQDTILETDNPALAWQALMTTVYRMAYYDWLPTFDSMSDVNTVSRVPCQMPVRYNGFIIVATTLAIHLSLFIVVTVWFYKGTQISLLHNSWQVVAQLVSVETESVLENATMMDDKGVKDWTKQNPGFNRRFRIKS
ncbi:uncharacterized protein K452DRAFT_201534, partial [Aplosporella prunicola CBS 121167]